MYIDKNYLNINNQLRIAFSRWHLIIFFYLNTKNLLTTRTKLGNAWVFIKPLVPVTIFTIVFGFIFQQNSEQVPFLIFLLSAYTLWSLFDDTLYWTTRTFDGNKKVLKKFDLPFLLLPIGASIMGIVMSSVNFFFLIFAIIYYSFFSTAEIFISLKGLIVFFISYLICYMTALGLGFFLSILNAKYRDTKFSVKIVLGFMLYLIPLNYPMSKLPEFLQSFYPYILPILGPILNGRYSFLYPEKISYSLLIYSFTISIMLIILGINFFLRKVSNDMET